MGRVKDKVSQILEGRQLPASGAISLDQIHVEAGGTSGTNCTINDADIRGLIGKNANTTMSFSEWYGASNIPAPTYTHDLALERYKATNGLTGYTYREGRYRQKFGEPNLGSLKPSWFYASNGNRLYIQYFKVSWNGTGELPQNVYFDAYFQGDENYSWKPPVNAGWEYMIYTHRGTGRTVNIKRSEMKYVTGENWQGAYDIRWSCDLTAGNQLEKSTLFFEDLTNGDNPGTLDISI